MLDFADAIARLRPKLVNFTTNAVKSRMDAEDIVSACVIRALEKRDQFTPGTNLESWLFKIVRNEIIDRYRERVRKKTETLTPVQWNRLAIQPLEEQNRLTNEMIGLVSKLKWNQRDAIFSVYIDGCSYEEAAERYNTTGQIIKHRILRGMNKIRAMLES